MSYFEILLYRNEEFEFIYKDKKYEIVSEFGRSIYTSDNTLVSSFKDNDDLLFNAIIEGTFLKNILDEIKFPEY